MKNYIDYISDYYDGTLSEHKRKWFEKELVCNDELRGKYNLYKQLNDTMRAKRDIEEIMSNTNREAVNSVARQMVSEFNQNPDKYNHARSFISSSLNNNSEFNDELGEIRKEIATHNVSEETQKWVNDWIKRKEKDDAEAVSRRDFIMSSLNESENTDSQFKRRKVRTIAIGIMSFAAAAAIAAIVIVKTLAPSYTPDSLYAEYYKPLNAYSTTTRNSANVLDPFSNAVALYNQGKYKSASETFTNLLSQEPNNVSYQFFSGITCMGLEDYNNASILLYEVVSGNGHYKKEAQWYLALSYLKTKEIEKATKYLTELSKSNGYYQKQAQDLLSHLR